MKRIAKLIATLLLVISLIFNAVSCDLLLPYINGETGGNTIPDGGDNIPDNGGETPGDGGETPDDGDEIPGSGENKPSEDEKDPNEGDNTEPEEKIPEFYFKEEGSLDLTVGDIKVINLVKSYWLEGEVIWTTSNSCVSVEQGVVIARSEGAAVITATLGNLKDTIVVSVSEPEQPVVPEPDIPDDGPGETIIVPGTEDPVTSDPYINVDKEAFYENYTPAISYMDAYYRTQHGLMSGSIEKQDQAPTISEYRPERDGKYIRNNIYLFSEDGNTYYVVDCYGEIAFEIYRGGAYVILEEIAAYVFAFGEPPANHTPSKKTKPTQSIWGEYLRLNHTKFSGDTSKYRYEPELPRISGCGGDMIYYEMDIGTTGTDCDPGYDVREYNNGLSIVRGAARIVYTYKDKDGNSIIDLDERYVFYTYNHYNDFQEYLNYAGGWGKMFGNITGGGSLSDNTNYNPTDYVEVHQGRLQRNSAVIVMYFLVPDEKYAA